MPGAAALRGLAQDLAALLPPDFLRTTPFPRIKHLPRYVRGMKSRADRWKRDSGKDAQRAAELAPFVAAVKKLGPAAGELAAQFRMPFFNPEYQRWLDAGGAIAAKRD